MKTSVRVFSTLLGLAMLALPLLAGAAGPSSEFLDIHPDLKPDPERPGAWIWEKPGLDRAKYTKVLFAPLSLFLAPDSEYKGFNADDVKALAAGFEDTLMRTLEPEIAVVNAAGSGVLYVRPAFTGVKLKRPKRGPLGYTPIGLIVTAAQAAAGKRTSLQEAKLEVELYDAATGEPLAVIIDTLPRKQAGAQEEFSWKTVENTLKFYATRFKARATAGGEKSD
jgi:hypothetical protein